MPKELSSLKTLFSFKMCQALHMMNEHRDTENYLTECISISRASGVIDATLSIVHCGGTHDVASISVCRTRGVKGQCIVFGVIKRIRKVQLHYCLQLLLLFLSYH